jgi:prevent-host-death family protein
MVRRLTISAARKDFADTVNRAFYNQEATVVTKHGRDIAAVVPINQLNLEVGTPPKKHPQRADL